MNYNRLIPNILLISATVPVPALPYCYTKLEPKFEKLISQTLKQFKKKKTRSETMARKHRSNGGKKSVTEGKRRAEIEPGEWRKTKK